MLIGWSDNLLVKQVIANDFCFEIEFEEPSLQQTCWGIFDYASADKHIRREQFRYLAQQQDKWGDRWFLGGDLNDIRKTAEKKGGRDRS